ncbi:tetratricopeptide repeat protein [bacterium]|nr:tetratricopeptide repeat protein [candidate division CSSED10-310 bacterium]
MDKFQDQKTDRIQPIERKPDPDKDDQKTTDIGQEAERDEVQIWLEEGEKCLADRGYTEAIALFEKILRVDPDNIQAYEKLSIARSGKADLESVDEYLAVARECMANQDWKSALSELQAVLSIDPDHEEVRKLLQNIRLQLDSEEDLDIPGQESVPEREEPPGSTETIPETEDQEFPMSETEDPGSHVTEAIDRAISAMDQSGGKSPESSEPGEPHTDIEQEIESAISLYESGELKRAKEILTRLNRNIPDHSQIRYYLDIVNRKLEDGQSSQNQQDIERIFKEGMDELEKENFSGASTRFKQILSINPEFNQARLMLDKINTIVREKFDKPRPVEASRKPAPAKPVQGIQAPRSPGLKYTLIGIAVVVLGSLIYFFGVKYPDIKITDHLKTAKVLYAEKNYQKALSEVQAARKIGKGNLNVFELEGMIYMALGRGTEAAAAFKKALDINPRNVALSINLGEAYLLADNYVAAEKQFRQVVQNPSYRVEAYYKIGLCQSRLNQPENAIASFRKAIELNPEYARAYLELAKELKNQGDPKDAETEFLLAIEKDPKLIDAYKELGKYYIDLGRLEQAKEILNQPLLWLKPSNQEQSRIVADLRFLLGQVYFDSEEYDNAHYQFNKILEIKEDPDIYMELGKVYYKLNRNNQAILSWEKVLKLDPKNANAHFNLGTTYLKLGKLKTATDEFNEAIHLDPNHAKAYANLGLAYQKQYKYTQATDAWKKSLKIMPDQPALEKKIREIEGSSK